MNDTERARAALDSVLHPSCFDGSDCRMDMDDRRRVIAAILSALGEVREEATQSERARIRMFTHGYLPPAINREIIRGTVLSSNEPERDNG